MEDLLRDTPRWPAYVEVSLPSIPPKVDEAALWIGAQQCDIHPVAHIQAMLAAHEATLHGRIENAHENALGRHPRDHSGERLPHARQEPDRADPLVHIALHLARGVFLRSEE